MKQSITNLSVQITREACASYSGSSRFVFSPGTACPDWEISWVCSFPLKECRNSTLKSCKSFPVHPLISFIVRTWNSVVKYPTNYRYEVGKNCFLFPGERTEILRGNKLRGGGIENTESYGFSHYRDGLWITVVLFTLNFTSPVKWVLGRYLPELIPARDTTIRQEFIYVTMRFWGQDSNMHLDSVTN